MRIPGSSPRLKPRATDERLACARLRERECRTFTNCTGFRDRAPPLNGKSTLHSCSRSLAEARRSSVARGLSRREADGVASFIDSLFLRRGFTRVETTLFLVRL